MPITSSKNKSYILFGIVIILAWASYDFAIKNTITAWELNRQLEQRVIESSDLSYQPVYCKRKSSNLDKIISTYRGDTSVYRSNSIGAIASLADQENVKLANIPAMDMSYETETTFVQKLEFEGDYFSLLKFSKKLELTRGIGVVRSEDWRLFKAIGGNAKLDKLVLDIYLEILKK